MRRFILVFVALTTTAFSIGAVQADPPEAVVTPVSGAAGMAAPAPNPQFYNGSWWYRMPDGRWLYYANGQWLSPPAQAVYAYPNYGVAPGPYYPYSYPYAYPYGYGYPSVAGGLWIGGGWGGGWHGGGGGWHR